MIYVTRFCPVTRRVTASAAPSGFKTIDEVVMVLGEPKVRGARTATYHDEFYSEYQLHTAGPKVFFNRE